jgi:23S rRNA (cytosine1962-C5)-methyltransferase
MHQQSQEKRMTRDAETNSQFRFVRTGKPRAVRLKKDLTRDIKRGHAWLFSQAVEKISAPAGSVVEVVDRRGDKKIAAGIFHPTHAITVRVGTVRPPFQLNDRWFESSLLRAWQLRKQHFSSATNGFRLVAGEGDGLPGLIIDVYGRTAVIKLDGGGPEAFYQPIEIADWLGSRLDLEQVVYRPRGRGQPGKIIWSANPATASSVTQIGPAVSFLENGLRFTADVFQGQKTGFFLDQRDNRYLIHGLSYGRSVLNLFSFSGGFSVAAGVGGAEQVTSVDVAQPAIQAANQHWDLNGLTPKNHQGIASDCFDFLEAALAERRQWDIVICDPPSFAPSEKAIPQAMAAYDRLAYLSSRVTAAGGLLALASCSSHVTHAMFTKMAVEALGRSRRKARLIADRGLPIDHPTPLAMPELRYLKFLLLQLD